MGNPAMRHGAQEMVRRLRDSGRDEFADQIEVTFGDTFGREFRRQRTFDRHGGLGPEGLHEPVTLGERAFTGPIEGQLLATLNAALATGVDSFPEPIEGFERFAEDDDRIDAGEFMRGLNETGITQGQAQQMIDGLNRLIELSERDVENGEKQNRNRPPAGVGGGGGGS